MTYQQAATVSRQYRESWLKAAPYLTPRERAAMERRSDMLARRAESLWRKLPLMRRMH